MKKTLIILMMVLLSAMFIVSCDDNSKTAYTVTFISNGGSNVDPAKVNEGEKATKPTNPTKTGYDFVKWTTDEEGETEGYDFENTVVTEDITLYAQWTDKYCTVTFNSKEGSAIEPAKVKYGKTVDKPNNPTRIGYNFVEWTTDEKGTTEYKFESTVTEDIALYAQWSEIVYTVGELGPAGGYVFYDKGSYSDGWRYLEAAPSDLSNTMIFGKSDSENIDASAVTTGTAIGTGKANTTTLNDKNATAAVACNNHSVTKDGKTYTGWFLPSKDELEEMHKVLYEKNKGSFEVASYWSSSMEVKDGHSKVYRQVFGGDNTMGLENQSNKFRVRPVRAF